MAAWSPAAAARLFRGSRGLPFLHCVQRMFASQTEGELRVTQVLKEKFPQATAIKVTDISGGCGAMYEIQIESEEFKEKRTVQQHQMVNQMIASADGDFRVMWEEQCEMAFKSKSVGLQGSEADRKLVAYLSAVLAAKAGSTQALKEEIKGMHGLRIFTSVPKH